MDNISNLSDDELRLMSMSDDELMSQQSNQSQQTSVAPIPPSLPRPPSQASPPAFTDAIMDTARVFQEGLGKTLGDYGRGIVKATSYVGDLLPPEYQQVSQLTRKYLADEQEQADERFKPYQEAHPMVAGAPQLLPALAPGMNTLKGAAIGGGLLEGLRYSDNQMLNTLLGAGGSAAGQKSGELLGRLMSKGANKAPGAQAMLDAGIPITTGGQLGGVPKYAEDLGHSLPFVGHVVDNRRKESLEAFSKASVNKALKHSGTKLPAYVKSNGMFEADNLLSHEYDRVLDFDFDPNNTSLNNIFNKFNEKVDLTGKEQAKMSVIVDRMLEQATKKGRFSGSDYKKLDRNLRFEQARFNKSQDVYVQDLGKEVGNLRADMAELIDNPYVTDRIKELDTSFAKLRTLDKAAGSAGAQDGFFTPAQYINAQKSYLGSREMAQRTNEDLQFGEDARKFLSSNVGNSFTTDRKLASDVLGGVVGLMSYGAMPPPATIGIGTAGLLGAAGGSQRGQKLINSLLFDRPQGRAFQGLANANIPERLGAVLGAKEAAKHSPSIQKQIEELEEEMWLLP